MREEVSTFINYIAFSHSRPAGGRSEGGLMLFRTKKIMDAREKENLKGKKVGLKPKRQKTSLFDTSLAMDDALIQACLDGVI